MFFFKLINFVYQQLTMVSCNKNDIIARIANTLIGLSYFTVQDDSDIDYEVDLRDRRFLANGDVADHNAEVAACAISRNISESQVADLIRAHYVDFERLFDIYNVLTVVMEY